MTSRTAATLAVSINSTLDSDDLDENLKIAFAVSKTGKTITRSITKFYGNEEIATADAISKAEGYSNITVRTEYLNWYNLDWKIIAWVCPLGQADEWSTTDSWEAFCIEQGLDPLEHIKRAAYEFHCDKVSLFLWNRRKAVSV